MESVREDGENKLLVTSLTNEVMPFIRYQIGDSGALRESECSCGSGFPTMEMGVCRSNDIIRTPAGKRIYPAYFIHLLDDLSGIRQYQFEQDTPDRIKLHIASDHRLSDEIIRTLQTRVSTEVDEQMTLNVVQTGEIPRTVSGKHRFVISYAAD